MESQSHEERQGDLVDLTANIVSAYVANNRVPPAEMPALLASVHAAIASLTETVASEEAAVDKPSSYQIRKSITPDTLISFIDGKPYKTLKRHITKHGMTTEEYRGRYGLPLDYPIVAASYSERRSTLAKSLGLGNRRRKAAPKAAEVSETVVEAAKAGNRKKAAEPAAKPTKGRTSKKAEASE